MPFYEFEGKKPLIAQDAFVHPEAVLIGDVAIESGCYVGAGAVLRGDFGGIMIGKGSNVQENCVLHTRPNTVTMLHPETHIGHGSILHGCEICSFVQIGMGSIIMDEVKINSYCLIGAGTLIPFRMEIPEKSLVIGSPAKVTKKITQEQLERMAKGRAGYQELAKRCLKSLRPISF